MPEDTFFFLLQLRLGVQKRRAGPRGCCDLLVPPCYRCPTFLPRRHGDKLNTATADCDKTNESGKSEDICMKELKIAEDVLGPYHPPTVQLYIDFGDFYRLQRPTSPLQAEHYYRTALKKSEKMYGFSHRITVGILIPLIEVTWGYEKPE
ncbi:hypothetical protein K458DRAFT_44189 [Lentithecium fluviatile CBS 122367]|uniref:Uncharacterized protein n=1 Tax=Lentithecium fluviatile CBS 122367 TaxID=1168545 RepID=A0A6G1IYD5_9PLEO|nr:hypothetical protein K458DRAFT_44189 [Lentithecium fluviatile CBS 122367]